VAGSETEPERQRRLVDMAVSMHAALRDRYTRLGLGLLLVVLGASALGLAFAFAPGDPKVTVLSVEAERSIWLGWLALCTFVVTLADLVLDLRGKARERDSAVRALAALKAEYRSADLADPDDAARLAARYAAVTDAVPPIPERRFLALKAAHHRKVELSKIVSARPGIRTVRARWILWRRNASSGS
jgi:hypothetical protein